MQAQQLAIILYAHRLQVNCRQYIQLVLIVLIDRFPGPEGNREGMSARANEIVAIFKPIAHCLTKLDPPPPTVKAARDYSEVRAAVAK